MGIWNAFYVKALDRDAAAAIRNRFPKAELDSSPTFIGVHLADEDFKAPESELAELSASLGVDVIWLSFQSVVDAFQFHHWHKGRHARALVYGCFADERTWERVEGEAEPWEREVLFDEEGLEHVLEFTDSDEQREELQRIWKNAEIVPGNTEPGFDARSCAHKIAAHYGFPHYGL
jgi:hypothetical protein